MLNIELLKTKSVFFTVSVKDVAHSKMSFILKFIIIFAIIGACKCYPKNTKIVIIGAGPAGISALAKLIENGYTNITLLEASDRIGGRIRSVPYKNGYIDLGAQFIHGAKGNIVYEMVKSSNITSVTLDSTFKGDVLPSEGSTIPYYSSLHDLCTEIYNNECAPPMSYEKFFENR